MGNVSRPVSSSACCQDYVIGSPSTSVVRVLFDAASLDTFPAGAGAGAMTAADLDCDEDLDLAITAPSADAFVLLAGGGNGTFSLPLPKPAGSAPQDVATGDVDGDGDPDVAVSNDDGGFSVARNQCNGFSAPDSYEIYPTTTSGMPIAMGKLCPGHPNDVAVAVGIFDIVYLTCGDGSGSFANVVEPHGVQVAAPYDYRWDPTTGLESSSLIRDLFVWGLDQTLYALRIESSSSSEIVWLPPLENNLESGPGRTLVFPRGGETFSELVLHVLQGGGDSWTRGAFVGSPGIGVVR